MGGTPPKTSLGDRGRLPQDVLAWGLKSIKAHGDNDLFPLPFEFSVFDRNWSELAPELAEVRVDCYRWSQPRKLLLPRDRLSFRHACQLDPLDSLILTAIAHMAGTQVEAKRQPRDTVFSSRLTATGDSLYDSQLGWEQFWQGSAARIEERGVFVARTDIADFYNQIRHADVLARLEVCGVPERLRQAVANFLDAFGGGFGKGVPIGPHAGHLLAEASVSRLDELLKARGLRFNRYIDDFHIFCDSEEDAQLALFDIADVLYAEFGLALNRMKTSIVPKDAFLDEAKKRGREAAPTTQEEALLEAIRAVTDSDYDFATFEEIFEAAPEAVADETIEALLREQFSSARIDYPKLGWLLRRLAQVEAPGGVGYVLEHFEDFVPVIGATAQYLARAGAHWTGQWLDIGQKVLEHTANPIVEKSPYVQAVMLSLFAQRKELNHIEKLLRQFPNAPAPAKQAIILAAREAGSADWLHSLRNQANELDSWSRRAWVYATAILSPQQRAECLKAIRAEAQGADSILLGALLADRTAADGDTMHEPSGPAWPALLAQVPNDCRELIEERLEALGQSMERDVRAGVAPDDLLIATWNLRNLGGGGFGFGDRLPESLLAIARVLLAFDLIAVQEVRDESIVDRLLELLGSGWTKLLCGEATGEEGNSEMSAFLCRSSRLTFLGKVEQVVLGRRDLVQGKYQFARQPFLGNFQTARSKLTVCTSHTYFGAARGEKYKRRVAEIETLAKLVVRLAEREQSTAVLLGDLNVVGPDDATMKPLRRYQIALADRYLRADNVKGDKFYTQIAFKPTQEGMRLRGSGVFPVFTHVFREEDQPRYASEMKRTQAWDTASRKGDAPDPTDFYGKWRTYQLSDHMPVWVRFAV